MPMARRVRPTTVLLFAVACLGAANASCNRLRHVNYPSVELFSEKWSEPSVPPGTYPDSDRAAVDGLANALAGKPVPVPPATGLPTKPLNVLALSAGGKYGAYSAGVLCGWTESGTRPTFDVVTGVSTGAILALYAFQGSQYDGKLKKFFTTTKGSDLFRTRPVRNLVRYGSISTADGLKKIIDEEVTAQFLCELRASHMAGRRLFIGTLNAHTKRLIIWDIGAVACSGRPDADDFVRKIILAACAIPGMVPPVEFDVIVNGKRYQEVHTDGGAVTQTFMKFGPNVTPAPGTQWLAGSNLYAISAGKLYADPTDGRLNLLDQISASVSASLYALYRVELLKLYTLCVTSGMTYQLVVVPDEVRGSPRSMLIEPVEMTNLFNVGVKQASGGVPWRMLPPGAELGEEETPRTGTTFTSPSGR